MLPNLRYQGSTVGGNNNGYTDCTVPYGVVNVCTDVAITLTPELDKRAKVLVLEVQVLVDTVF